LHLPGIGVEHIAISRGRATLMADDEMIDGAHVNLPKLFTWG
jgi:hypothetical protein